MSDRFYVNSALSLGELLLDGDEAHHLAVVCRLRPGEIVTLFNGDGNDYIARIDEAHKRQVTLSVERCDVVNRELAYPLQVAVPLPKGDRAQFLVEKLTELGVSVLTPLQTERSVVHPRETKLEKLHRYVIEASKQCGRNVLMTIDSLHTWGQVSNLSAMAGWKPAPQIRLIAHPGGTPLREVRPASGPTILAIGTEGGFTDSEVETARSVGWQTVSLGSRILRVETAALSLAAWFAFHCPSGAQPLQ